MEDNTPFFSIIIPTRNRHETLPFAIKTVTNQNFSNYELIICDNNSTTETKNIVSKLNNNKIRYIRSDEDLSMSDNWELALSKAKGTYIIIFGDDDGILPYALKELHFLISKTKAKIIRWDRIYYSWPSIMVERAKNKLIIPLKTEYTFNIINSHNIINKIVNGNSSYTILPMLYNSAIHKSLIEEAKTHTNRVFSATQPDIYSGYLFAYLEKNYLSIDKPMTINGGSSKSNGTASFSKENNVTKEFNDLIQKSELSFHESIPYVKSMPAYIAEPFVQLSDIFKLDANKFIIDKKRLFINIISNLKVSDLEEWEDSIAIIISKLKNDKSLYKWISNYTKNIEPNFNETEHQRNIFDGNNLILDASVFSISNVYDASVFVGKLLEKQKTKLKKVQIDNQNLNNKQSKTILYKALRRIYYAFRILFTGK